MERMRHTLMKERSESFMFYVIHNLYNVGIGCKDRKEVIGYGIRGVEKSRNLRRCEVKSTKGGVRCLGNF
jgi:hypothetical protein